MGMEGMVGGERKTKKMRKKAAFETSCPDRGRG